MHCLIPNHPLNIPKEIDTIRRLELKCMIWVQSGYKPLPLF